MADAKRLALLADKAECTELVHRMARAIDRCDADLLASLFHPDATDDHGLFSGTAVEFGAWVMPLLKTMKQTQHVVGQTLIEVDDDRAAGESYFVAYHIVDTPDGEIFMIAAGRYLDRFERRDGVWKMSHRHAVYDWSSSGASTDTYNRAEPGNMTFGKQDASDPSYAHLAFGKS